MVSTKPTLKEWKHAETFRLTYGSACTKPTLKEWKRVFSNHHLQHLLCTKPTLKEWKLVWIALPGLEELQYEAYLEGMETAAELSAKLYPSLSTKPTLKEWKLQHT